MDLCARAQRKNTYCVGWPHGGMRAVQKHIITIVVIVLVVRNAFEKEEGK